MPRPLSFVWLVLSATPLWAASQPETPEFFETRIRPILANSCYGCHAASHLGGLRVDSRDALLKGGATGPALVAGDPEKSLLIKAVRQTGDLKMPKGSQLKKEEIEDLVAWVKAGAPWPPSGPASAAPGVSVAKSGEYVITPQQRAFWSFRPLASPSVPEPRNGDWARTAIDKFILARLEKEGLTPVRPADKRTLLRRATLDLTGLPPTSEEFEAFEKDTAPDAFAKVVDKLLASSHYGERWGRLWLDVARYGEDDYRSLDPQGRGHNPYPNAYLYRDWVIQSFNNDLPFDQFVKAQLAADQLDEKVRHKMLPALGFLGQGPWFYDNGAVEVTRADERNDRVDVVTRGFLGLTAACARCHDHKYDPIPTKDYYSLAGVFASTEYHEYPQVPTALVKEFEAAEKKLKDKQKLLGEIMQNDSMQLAETLAVQSAKYMQAAWRITGEPKDELFQVAEQQKLDYELLERWVRFLAKPPKFYPYLEKWQEMVKRGGTASQAKKLAEEFQATLLDVMFEKRAMKEENEIIVAKSLPGTKKKEMSNKPNEFVTNDDFCPGCSLQLKVMPTERINLWTDIFQRDLTGEDQQQVKVFRPGLLVFRGYGLERQLTGERREYLKALRDDIDATRKAMPAQFPFIHGVRDVEKPVDLPVSLRGSPYNMGEVQSRHFLSILVDGKPEAFAHGSGRLDLANAIVAQPIALRVWVNRIWKGHFGTGLVDSPSNFGFTGERPTNPDLLEYLATFFRDHQYSTKALHREILLSAVYQLSTEDSAPNFAKDSGNRLYWRANRHRMDAEQIRDSFLAVAGNLEDKLFGPSRDLATDYKRRTVYGKVSRYHLDDYLQLFDFPSANISAEKRFSTNVPQQRLFFMNSDFAQQQGELLAKRTAEEPDRAARVQKMYRILFGRAATDAEVAAGIEYVKSEPMKEYEERKAAKAEKDKDKKPGEAKDEPKEEPEATADKPPDGMLAGMNPRGARPGGDAAKPMLPVTPWGRYAKILMSSPEFVFVN